MMLRVGLSSGFILKTRKLSSVARAWSETYISLSQTAPVTTLSQFLGQVHDQTDLSWASLILGSGFVLRFITMFPAHVTAQKTATKRQVIMREMHEEVVPELKHSIAFRAKKNKTHPGVASRELQVAVKRAMKEKILENNCSAAKIFLPYLLQIPVWMTMTMALRNQMTMIHYTKESLIRHVEFKTEGCLWFTNLNAPDPLFILPLSIGLCLIINQEISSRLHRLPEGQKLPLPMRISKGIGRLVPFIFVPLCCYIPSGLTLYWAISGVSGLLVNILLMQPKVRRMVRIPLTPNEPAHPLRFIKDNFIKDIETLKNKIRTFR